jgi:hypothetical protein
MKGNSRYRGQHKKITRRIRSEDKEKDQVD